jgi:hypothetical protein
MELNVFQTPASPSPAYVAGGAVSEEPHSMLKDCPAAAEDRTATAVMMIGVRTVISGFRDPIDNLQSTTTGLVQLCPTVLLESRLPERDSDFKSEYKNNPKCVFGAILDCYLDS